ncbi:Oidioi.mRNA.OKI2018_I69.chr2.g6955.t1.cds [Oikopleura dioica]|uniref:Oidioi.mRNA.OKI2018_I69.chr2.g6955.t1.cds n=1 Tax=Oikopleura dioica TaxID=34765 RepID=A0ABN7T5M5_OIKDI|nr:Oidioi.mRNA.OKI2018_I69.chr2.g6955.t1.cds [Oikopleura dioica]
MKQIEENGKEQIRVLRADVELLKRENEELKKSLELTGSGIYRAIDNLTQFINEIQQSQQKQEKRLQELEKPGKPSSPEKKLKARSQTVDVEPAYNEACVDESQPATDQLPAVTKIESGSADSSTLKKEAPSTEEETTAGDSTGDPKPSPSTIRREEKRKRENRKATVSYLSPEDVVTALKPAKERRKMRLQSFRKALENIDDAARSTFGGKKKNKPTIEEIEAKIKDVEKKITGEEPTADKNQAEIKEECKENTSVEAEKPKNDGKFERIKARDTGFVPEKETTEPEKFFPRVGSLRSLKRREEIIEKLRKKKEAEAEEERRRSAPAQISSPILRTAPENTPANLADKSEEKPVTKPRSPRPQVPPPEKPAELAVASPLPSPPLPPEKKSIDTIQGRVQCLPSREHICERYVLAKKTQKQSKMNFLKEEPEEIEIAPVPKARASAPVILSRESAATKTKDKEKEEKQDAKESEQERPEDIHVGLTRHDYKTLSNTPKMKEFEVSEKPSKIIKPHDYEMPVAEVAKARTPPSPTKTSSNNSPYSVKVLPKKRIGRISAFDSIEEEPKSEPLPPKPPRTPEPKIIIEDDELPEAFRRPVLRASKNKSKPPRPMSESVDYNPDLVEKLEGPALQRVLSLGPGERFKRSSIRRKKFFMGETRPTTISIGLRALYHQLEEPHNRKATMPEFTDDQEIQQNFNHEEDSFIDFGPFEEDPETFEYNEIGIDQPTNVTEEFVLVLSDLAGSSPSNNEITIPIEQPRPQSVGSYEIYHNRTERTHQVIRPRSSTINEFSPYPSVNDNSSRKQRRGGNQSPGVYNGRRMTYAELIVEAIKSSKDSRMTLRQIYHWMSRNVREFGPNGGPGCPSTNSWKNSIRHNLSLHEMFKRVPNHTRGESAFWVIDTTPSNNNDIYYKQDNNQTWPHVRPELFRPSLTCPPNVRLEANYQVPNFDKIRQSATNSFCQDLIICEKFPELARIIFPKKEPKVEPIIRLPSISLDNIPDSHSDNELFSAMFSKPPSENDFSSCASPSNSEIFDSPHPSPSTADEGFDSISTLDNFELDDICMESDVNTIFNM